MGGLSDRGQGEGGVARHVFFVDRSLGRYDVPAALREAGESVEMHDAHFPSGTTDPEWLRLVGERKWVVLTKDYRIKHRPLQREAIRSGGIRQFTFVSGQVRGVDMAAAFVRALPAMKRLLDTHAGPFIAKVFKDGRVAMWERLGAPRARAPGPAAPSRPIHGPLPLRPCAPPPS